MNNESIIDFRDVSLKFSNKILLDKVSFSVLKGTITTLLGQNGAGKSTIAKLIVGLTKASKGQIVISKGTRIGYVPQQISLFKDIPMNSSALLNILAPKYDIDFLNTINEFLDIGEGLNKNIAELSGGQLQKLVLIGTILNKPDLLLLDEPTQYLDVSSQQQFYKLLSYLQREYNQSVFMISHDLFTVMKNSDQVICLNGHVCCSGKPAEINANTELKNAISEISLYVHNHDHKHN